MRSPKKGNSGRRAYFESPTGHRIYLDGDKRFVLNCYGENWSMDWLRQSNVTLKDLFEQYDVKLTEMLEEEVIYLP
tara:strand:- start:77 stop:304 length:228 start_codon:yes stop_codon:yes gene_type:complete